MPEGSASAAARSRSQPVAPGRDDGAPEDCTQEGRWSGCLGVGGVRARGEVGGCAFAFQSVWDACQSCPMQDPTLHSSPGQSGCLTSNL